MTMAKKIALWPESAQQVAGPAYNPVPRPLKVGSRNQVEGRAGAYDYRNVPSLMGGSRVPFVSSLTVSGSDGEPA